MLKIVLPSSFDFDSHVMSIVDVHSRGVDKSWLSKSAAVLTKELKDLRPEKGVTFTHLIALGDQEYYGLNRNGDGFPEKECQACHSTFVKHAKWFHNHKNKPDRGDPSFGFVKHSAHNPEMHRTELIVGIYEDKDPDSIQKLANGEDIPVSMACNVPYDECTICGNKARSRKEYCDHLKKYATQMTKEGHQIGMVNRNPDFFDISKVHRNADRIAFTLRKAASADGAPMLGVDMAQALGITPPEWLVKDSSYHRRYGLIRKLAAMEKEIEGTIEANPSMQCIAEGLNEPCASVPEMDEGQLNQVFTALADARVSLPLEDFLRLVTGGRFDEVKDLVPEAKEALPGVFSDCMSCPDELLSGTENYEPLDLSVPNLVNSIVRKMAGPVLAQEPLKGRVTTITLRKKAGIIVPYKKSRNFTKAGQVLAREYARYKLAFLDKVDDDFVTRMSVLQNFG